MSGVGNGLIVTGYCAVVTAQVVAVIVSVTCTHPAKPVPHVTVMELVPAPKVIEPPLIDQL
jgi:hypothetical protein